MNKAFIDSKWNGADYYGGLIPPPPQQVMISPSDLVDTTASLINRIMDLEKNVMGLNTAYIEKPLVKCRHCGQWGAVYCACAHCGAPIDPE